MENPKHIRTREIGEQDCREKRSGSISMKDGKHFSTKNLANALHSMEENDGPYNFLHFEDNLFDILREGKDTVPLRKFLSDLTWMGLRKDDPRLKESMKKIENIVKAKRSEDSEILLNRDTFRECICDNIVLIKKAFEAELIIPEFQKFCQIVDKIFEKCQCNCNGKASQYLPQFARYDPKCWAVSVCTVDGQRYSVGDVDDPFALQSSMKPLLYALALSELGPETVHQYVGQEPSGEQFDQIKLDPNGHPHNPMINAGGIVTASLIKRKEMMADRYDYVQTQFKKLAGGEYIGFNNAMYLTERESANRNFALGYYLQENKCFPEGTNLKNTLDFYFQLCSMEVSAESLAVVAATLANGGICPMTGEECLSGISVQNVLSLMYSCGMYDYSGQFAFQVGLPSKASISGSIMMVVPNVMGICMWSPLLDRYNNSSRGLQFCKELVREFTFHQYDCQQNRKNRVDPRNYQDVTVKDSYYLVDSAHKGDLKALTRMYLVGVDMQACDYDGRTALHVAAAEGHFDCVKFLLSKCEVPHDDKDRWAHTPLDEAKRFGHTDVAKFIQEFATKHQKTINKLCTKGKPLTDQDATNSTSQLSQTD